MRKGKVWGHLVPENEATAPKVEAAVRSAEGAPSPRRFAGALHKPALSVTYFFPTLRFGAGQDGVADCEFVVTVLESAEINFLGDAGDIGVNAEEKIFETVWIGFRMAARIMGVGAGALAEERGVFHEQFVRFFPITDPHFVRPFLIPDDRAF